MTNETNHTTTIEGDFPSDTIAMHAQIATRELIARGAAMPAQISKTFRTGNVLITVTIETRPAVIDFQDILAAARIEPDDDYNPFEMGCMEHTTEPAPDDADTHRMRSYHCVDMHRGSSAVIVPDDVSKPAYFRGITGRGKNQRGQRPVKSQWESSPHARIGAARQVAEQMSACDRRHAIKAIADTYREGCAYWVNVEYEGCRDSLGGIDSYSYAQECARDCALEVARQLESEGFTVEGKPEPTPQAKTYWRRMDCQTWNAPSLGLSDERAAIERHQRHATRKQRRTRERYERKRRDRQMRNNALYPSKYE